MIITEIDTTQETDKTVGTLDNSKRTTIDTFQPYRTNTIIGNTDEV